MQDFISRIAGLPRHPRFYVPLIMVVFLIGGILFRQPIQNLINGKSRPIGVATGEPLPGYKGRPLREIKDNPESIKIFDATTLNNYHKQIIDAAGSIDANPDMLEPWLQLGLYKYEIGDFIGARDAWAYAGVIRPQNAVSFKNLGDLYWHKLKDNQQAELNYLKVIENDPAYLPGYISLSELYRYSYTEKSASAESVLLNGLRTAPDDPDMIAYIAGFYKDTGNKPKAIEYYKKLLKFRPNDSGVMDELRKLGA